MSILSKSFSTLPKSSQQLRSSESRGQIQQRPIPNKLPTLLPQCSPPHLQSITISHTPTPPSRLLTTLKSRKRAEEIEITPKLAAQVVKKYLLPMFDKKKSLKADLNRKLIMGTSAENLTTQVSTAESSIFEELQLSEQLLKELENNSIVLAEAESKVARCEQEKYEMREELEKLVKDNEDLIVNFNTLKLQVAAGNKNTQTYEMILYMMQKQLENYKKLYKINEGKLDQVSHLLSEERSKNDIRFIFYCIFL